MGLLQASFKCQKKARSHKVAPSGTLIYEVAARANESPPPKVGSSEIRRQSPRNNEGKLNDERGKVKTDPDSLKEVNPKSLMKWVRRFAKNSLSMMKNSKWEATFSPNRPGNKIRTQKARHVHQKLS
jgi:hypothetical protein